MALSTTPAPPAIALLALDNLAFHNALDAHLSTLLDSERAVFAGGTPEAALQLAAELDTDHRGRSRLRKWAGVLTKLVNGIDRYMKVVDTMVSSHPEIAALVWGGLYFVIEASHCVSCQISRDGKCYRDDTYNKARAKLHLYNAYIYLSY